MLFGQLLSHLDEADALAVAVQVLIRGALRDQRVAQDVDEIRLLGGAKDPIGDLG